mmetsp:Transcript_4787/g.14425  ORF Transcript_4787/g.14425 Transcript_4787/m.14425 type:complete len:367 (+) Transcript_4787:172-1272(+)|eukprot:CAMPEP_0198733292 /NCGR_PEP_ID=MMETSP1475-20131203/44436_1 /TAXON_ID= ORGANISM="Unidentified sp., Strain CCMP1999" /NCGR_SAMPLE_ID=MMETSP1475 /ASSEMBLY_ACC=CAM_ASM_001111 /LENGTH=366 /DNA_ID=CAMNT_0044496571 /DNA_START=153 /DNA_END=1253 /DNA_ORIENTATION=-
MPEAVGATGVQPAEATAVQNGDAAGGEVKKEDLGPTLIFENYYLGNRANAAKEKVMSMGITHVLNVSDRETFLGVGATYDLLNIPLCDFGTSSLEKELPAALKYIDNCFAEDGKILVHCSHGVNRSASVTLAYLMLKKKMTLKDAWVKVKTLRPIIFPHDCYLDQLRQIEEKVFGQITLTQEDTGPSIQEYLKELRMKAALADTDRGKELFDEETRQKLKKIDHVIQMNQMYDNVGARATSNVEQVRPNHRLDRDTPAGPHSNPISPRRSVATSFARAVSNVEVFRRSNHDVTSTKAFGRTSSVLGGRTKPKDNDGRPQNSADEEPSNKAPKHKVPHATPEKDWKPEYMESNRRGFKSAMKGLFRR